MKESIWPWSKFRELNRKYKVAQEHIQELKLEIRKLKLLNTAAPVTLEDIPKCPKLLLPEGFTERFVVGRQGKYSLSVSEVSVINPVKFKTFAKKVGLKSTHVGEYWMDAETMMAYMREHGPYTVVPNPPKDHLTMGMEQV